MVAFIAKNEKNNIIQKINKYVPCYYVVKIYRFLNADQLFKLLDLIFDDLILKSGLISKQTDHQTINN